MHAVREDPLRKGLLFAGTESGVYVSFNDGDNWQPLQINLPITSVRDLVVKGNDLVDSHARTFLLDTRQHFAVARIELPAPPASVHLFRPAAAIRVRKNEARDTPLPPETPAGKNPPAWSDHRLQSRVGAGRSESPLKYWIAWSIRRRYSSNDETAKPDETQAFPTYWFNPPAPLSKNVGLNRFVWDLRHERPLALRYGYSIAAAYGEDAIIVPQSPLVLPGTYQVKLTVGGRTLVAPLEVKLDPRLRVPAVALSKQHALGMKIIEAMNQSYAAVQQVNSLREQLKTLQSTLGSDPSSRSLLDAVNALDKRAAELVAVEKGWPPEGILSAATINAALGNLLVLVEGADSAPTTQAANTFLLYRKLLDQQAAKWSALKAGEVTTLNSQLQQRQVPTITIK